MSLWEYKAITSGKGGFATPALLESYLNQLGAEEWEIIEYRTQPDNALAFAGLARRPTQRDWTLEAAAAAAARAEADKLRAEFAAKFQAATTTSSAASAAKDDSGNPNRDDSFRRPRDTDSDQDPYALDDSASDEAEEIPPEDQLPTFFEAVRPHMRRNQKGPGYSVGLEYIVKKFEMLEDDLLAALVEIGFAIPEDEDDRPVYIEYDGDVYWLNVNRRGEVWINTREKPRPVFKTVKATRITPEEAQPEHVEAGDGAPHREEREGRESREGRDTRDSRDGRDGRRNDNRNRRGEQRASQTQAPVNEPSQASTEAVPEAAVPSSGEQAPTVGSEGASAPEGAGASSESKAQREAAPAAPLPIGLDLLERVRPMMRRSRGGWSGTISYLARALRHPEADLVAAFATIGLVVASNPGEKAPLVECGPFAFWLNKDGRGGIWINAREARRMRHEQKQAGAPEDAQSSSEPSAEASAQAPSTTEQPSEVAASSVAAGEASSTQEPAVSVIVEAPSPVVASPLDPEPVLSLASEVVTPPSPEVSNSALVSPAEKPAVPVERVSVIPADSASPFSGMRPLLKEFRPGNFSGELCFLAEQLGVNPEAALNTLLAAGLKAPEKVREKSVFVESAGEVFWLNRNAKGEFWLNAKPAKAIRKEDDEGEAESDEAPADVDVSAEEKKPRKPARSRKKTSGEE